MRRPWVRREISSGAIALAQGDVIFLCDQDDVWSPEKNATLMRRSNPTSA